LSRALLHGRVSNDPCLRHTSDRSRFDGHLYTDKAPGLSVLEAPVVAVLQPASPIRQKANNRTLWAVRLLTVGIAYLICAFLVGRVSEGLRPGFGGVSLVTFALGTLVGALAGTSFEAVPAATLAFAAFLLAWRRRPGLAGLAGGGALLIEYENGLVLLVLAAYVAVTLRSWRSLGRYAAGIIPGALLLAAYDTAAFDRPWRLSYRYLDNAFVLAQSQGIFGIGVPHRFATYEVFAGRGGLLIVSPVLLAAVYGLVRLARTRGAEVAVAAAVAAIFVVSNCGYFDPYGGNSPGPRFLAVSLPFLALGFAPAYARLPRLTLVLAVVSVIGVTALNLAWVSGGPARGGPWGELARVATQGGSSFIVRQIAPNILGVLGLGRTDGAVVVAVCAAAALVLAASTMPWAQLRAEQRPRPRKRPSLRVAVAAVAAVSLLAASNVMALANFPYGSDYFVGLVSLRTRLVGDTAGSYSGGYVNFITYVDDVGGVGAFNIVVTFQLSPGLHLAGSPVYTLGTRCTGTSTIVCKVPFLRPLSKSTATYRFGVQLTEQAAQVVTASAIAAGHANAHAHSNTVTYPISVG
jgi:hypothetical protein